MERGLNHPAQTIHRLLGWNPFNEDFEYNSSNYLPYDVIVIDEASMLDVNLGQALFQAINPTRTAVLIVGDHNQLPPVGAGNILRDVIETDVIPITKLKISVRQAGALDRNSNEILHGIVAKTEEQKEDALTRQPWIVFMKSDQQEILNYIGATYYHGLKRLGYTNLIWDVQLLSPRKDGLLGVNNLNKFLQRLIQKKLYGNIIADNEKATVKFYPGDKIIQVKNDYQINVMNGTLGIIKEIDKEYYYVKFEDREDVIFINRQDHSLRLAYALTIHKSQGSEFPCVISIIHKSHSFQHHRNLLYTAVTRAQSTSIILGDSWGIRNCAQKIETSKRRTFFPMLFLENHNYQEEQTFKSIESLESLDSSYEKMKSDERAATIEALQIIADSCDGAKTLDGAGFNKDDYIDGFYYANLGEKITEKQLIEAKELLRKYKRQIPKNLYKDIYGY